MWDNLKMGFNKIFSALLKRSLLANICRPLFIKRTRISVFKFTTKLSQEKILLGVFKRKLKLNHNIYNKAFIISSIVINKLLRYPYFVHSQPWNKISLSLFVHRQIESSYILSMHYQVLLCQGHQKPVSMKLKRSVS